MSQHRAPLGFVLTDDRFWRAIRHRYSLFTTMYATCVPPAGPDEWCRSCAASPLQSSQPSTRTTASKFRSSERR